MSDKKKRERKKTIASVYAAKIAFFLVITLALTAAFIAAAMPTAADFVHKVEAKFPKSSADIVINDELSALDKADYGTKIGVLESESCGLNCNVYYGANRVSMRHGAGLSGKKSAFGGYTYIIGYAESFFAPLHYIKTNDTISVKTADNTATYKVVSTGYVEKGKAAYNGGSKDVIVLCARESNLLSEHGGRDFYVIAAASEEVK